VQSSIYISMERDELNSTIAFRALQNPELFKADVYRHAALAISAGIAIRLLVEVPIFLVRVVLWTTSFFIDLSKSGWDKEILEGLSFIATVVLQVPYFLMSLRQIIPIGPSLDDMYEPSFRSSRHTCSFRQVHDQFTMGRLHIHRKTQE